MRKRNCEPDPEFTPNSVHVELDAFHSLDQRRAEGDGAALAQHELLALQEHFLLALDGDVGAVGADVDQDKLVLAPLDGAVLARSVLVGDDDAAFLAAADAHSVLLAPALEGARSEEHTSELQSQSNLVCRLLLEKKK